MSSSPNSRSDLTISFEFAATQPGDLLNDAIVAEFERRMQATVETTSGIGDAVVSVSPPDDTTKLWYPADANGVPTGEAFRFNSATSQWESTSPFIPDQPIIGSSSDNLISLDTQGAWQVLGNDVLNLLGSSIPFISGDSDNAIQLGGDGGWHVEVPIISSDTNNQIVAGSDGGFFVPVPTINDAHYAELYGDGLTALTASAGAGVFAKVPLDQLGQAKNMSASVGSSFIQPSANGVYACRASLSVEAGSGDAVIAAFAIDDAVVNRTRISVEMNASADTKAISLTAILNVTAAQRVTVVVQNADSALDIAIPFATFNLTRVE